MLLGSRVVALIFGFSLLSASVLWAAPTPEQRKLKTELETAVTKAGNLFKAGKYKECGDVVRDAQEKLEKATTGQKNDVVELFEPVFTRLKKAHSLLELEGVSLPPLKALGAAAEPAKPVGNGNAPAAAPAALPAGKVSFAKNVAPILVAKCGRCHIMRQSGMFNMTTFASLMQGPPAGTVIFPKDPNGSRLIEVIEQGDMPRGGSKITPNELTILKNWIKEGAVNDGPAPDVNLTSLAGDARAEAAAKIEIKKATGKETISFAKDIGPHILERCNGCHFGVQRVQGMFSMATFAALLKGGESGSPIAPGKPEESLLVQKLKGTGGGQRMPAGGRPPFSDDVIAKFEKWISEGATFDGLDPAHQIADVVALTKARNATHEELAADRAKKAADNWRLGMAGIPSDKTETENFLLLGNVGEATLAEHAKKAESLVPKIASQLKVPSGQPLFKGRMTLFFVKQRYDYNEFGKMVEKRSLPEQWRGHWMYNVVDAYGAVLPSATDAYTVDALLGQQIAGAYVASLTAPRWFAEGAGRSIAAKLAPKDGRVDQWNDQLGDLVKGMSGADDFLTGKMPPEDADIVSFGFVQFLMDGGNAKKFETLLASLRKGDEFAAAFSTAYGGSPSQLADAWRKLPIKRPAKSTTTKPKKP